MRPCLQLPVDLDDYDDENERGVVVNFTQESVPRWILELSLLQYELTEFACISDGEVPFRLQVELGSKQGPRGMVEWETGGAILRVTTQELEYWMSFFLQYYRDGIAPVDHIDVEIPPIDSSGGPGLFLTLTVPLSRPGGSEDEARRALELPPRPRVNVEARA